MLAKEANQLITCGSYSHRKVNNEALPGSFYSGGKKRTTKTDLDDGECMCTMF